MNDVSTLAEAQEMDEVSRVNDPKTSETAAMREFREDLNHKLRTPLNAIIGFAELLSLQGGRQRAPEGDVQQILNSARELLEIIERELAEPNGNSTSGVEQAEATRMCDVLYVEDDSVNFTLVERILEFRPGLILMHAPQGELGLQLAEAYHPKLVLLDLNLPDMHGSEVLQRLRQQAGTEQIPVVILSANATPSQIEKLLSAGAKNYLTKPFNIDHFLAVVDEFVTVRETPRRG